MVFVSVSHKYAHDRNSLHDNAVRAVARYLASQLNLIPTIVPFFSRGGHFLDIRLSSGVTIGVRVARLGTYHSHVRRHGRHYRYTYRNYGWSTHRHGITPRLRPDFYVLVMVRVPLSRALVVPRRILRKTARWRPGCGSDVWRVWQGNWGLLTERR